MRKSFVFILLILCSCQSGQIKDKQTIDGNNKTIGKTEKASEIIDKPELSIEDRAYIKDTLSDCKSSLESSNTSIKNCNSRENTLTKKINSLLPYKSKYHKLLFSVIVEHVLILLIIYLIYRVKINTAILNIGSKLK